MAGKSLTVSFLEAKVISKHPDGYAACSWQPEWKLTVGGSQGEAVVGVVQRDATITWCSDGLLKALGMTVADAQRDLVTFKRS